MQRVMQTLLVCIFSITCLSACSPLARGKNDFQLQKYSQAFADLLPIARQGDAEAQYAVGYMYYTGKGTTKDFDLALYWFERSAKQQNEKAVKALKMIDEAKESEPFAAPPALGLGFTNK